jgi:hypothetical protein
MVTKLFTVSLCRESRDISSCQNFLFNNVNTVICAEAKDFSSNLCVQTGSAAHPASCPVGTWGPFPGGKARPGREADCSPPSSAEVVNE